MIREVKEETGVQLEVDGLIPKTTFYVSYSDRNCIFHTFSAPLDIRPDITICPDEHQKFVWVTPKDALSLLLMIHGGDVLRHIYEIK